MTKKDLEKLSKEELINELLSKQSSGFSITAEKAALELQKKTPYLIEEQDKKIGNGKNILIKGENLYSLNSIKNQYIKKIKFIYIDPPYNTGKKDFMYNDSFVDKEDSCKHTKWLNFMRNRLEVAQEMLADDGVIFISINDAEFAHLKVLCDEIFNEKNFISSFIWKSGSGGTNDSSRNFSVVHEYILCYGNPNFKFNLDKKDTSKFMTSLPYDNLAYEGPRREGQFQLINLNKQKDYRVTIKLKDGSVLENYPSMAPQKSVDQWQELGEIVVNAKKVVYYKSFIEDEKQGKNFSSILDDLGTAKGAGARLGKLLGVSLHKMYPKPVDLMKHLLRIASQSDSLILDFFAGSGTIGQAVLELNEEDQGTRNFILCTNNESNICDTITYPRIAKIMKGSETSKGLLGDGLSFYSVHLKE